MQLLGKKRQVGTRTTVIGGGVGYPTSKASRRIWVSRNGHGHDRALVERMLERYGTKAAEVLAALPAGAAPLASVPGGYYAEELALLAREEQVLHLDDVLLRRTSLAFVGGLSLASLEAVAAAIAPTLGWSDETRAAEVTRAAELLYRNHRVQLGEAGVAPLA